MKVTKLILGTVLGAGLAFGANAGTFDLGSLETGHEYLFGDLVAPNTTVSDTINFHLDSTSDLTGFIASLGLDGFSAKLGSTSLATPGFFTFNDISFSSLVSGEYSLSVTGKATGFFLNGYLGGLTVAPVPEPETWAMLLVGTGLIGYQLSRKQKTIHQDLLPA